MNSSTVPGMEMLRRPRPWLAGVCAQIADRAGVPVWLPRALMLALLILNGLAALAIYAALAVLWRDWGRGRWEMLPPSRACGPTERFGELEARLAALEAATLSADRRSGPSWKR